jgi:hypothetical protein
MGLGIRWASRHRWRANGVRLVLLALLTTACANAKANDNANNASLTPAQSGPYCDQARGDHRLKFLWLGPRWSIFVPVCNSGFSNQGLYPLTPHPLLKYAYNNCPGNKSKTRWSSFFILTPPQAGPSYDLVSHKFSPWFLLILDNSLKSLSLGLVNPLCLV